MLSVFAGNGFPKVQAESTEGQTSVVELKDLGTRCKPGEDVEALEMLSAQIKGNQERIVTWSGSCETIAAAYFTRHLRQLDAASPPLENTDISDELRNVLSSALLEEDNGTWRITRAAVDFLVDNSSALYYMSNKMKDDETFWDVSSGRLVVLKQLHTTSEAIIRLDGSMEFVRGRLYGPITGHPETDLLPRSKMVTLVGAENVRRDMEFVDVRECFARFSGRGSEISGWYWRDFDGYAAYLRQENAKARETIQVFKGGPDGSIFTIVTGKAEATQSITTCDGKVGFNVVQRVRKVKGRVEADRRNAYMESANLFVPKEYSVLLKRPSSRDESAAVHFHKWSITTSSLNEPSPENAFDISRFGLLYGDRVLDEATSRLWIVEEDGARTDSRDFKLKPGKRKMPNSNQGNRTLLVVINCAVVLMVAFFVLRRRRCTKASGSGPQ